MQQLRRIIVESESTEMLNNTMSNKAATKKRHHSRNWYIKHKLRQINYEKAIRAYIGYLACNVSENSAFGRAKLIQFYKEKRPLPSSSIKLSTVDTSERIKLREDKMSFDDYRRQHGQMTKFSEYMKYYRS